MVDKNKYLGCFLGLAIGDAYGAPYEGGYIERLLWKMIGRTKEGKIRYTDDTQMSIDVAESFVENKEINQTHLALTFANSYRWSRGYGPSTGRMLKKIKNGCDWKSVNRAKFKEGSFGNGAAMRAPILALCYAEDIDALDNNIFKCSEITHAHRLAIEGAKLVALVTYSALHDWNNNKIFESLSSWCSSEIFRKKVLFCIETLKSTDPINLKLVKKNLGNKISAVDSCVTAIYFAVKFRDGSHDDMLREIYSLGGDTDTIGAMSGAIWGAFNGDNKLNKERIITLESSEKIKELANSLYQISHPKHQI